MHDLKPWVFFAFKRCYIKVITGWSAFLNDQFVCKIAKRNSQSDHSLPLKKYGNKSDLVGNHF